MRDEGAHRAVSDRVLPSGSQAAAPDAAGTLSAPDRLPADNVSANDGRPDLQRAARQCGGAGTRRSTADLETRFRTLVQSPLRAGILRYLSARPDESFDVESLMQTFGRLRLDVENCVRELVDFGVARAIAGTPPRYIAARPTSDAAGRAARHFLERRADRHAPKTSRRRSSASAR